MSDATAIRQLLADLPVQIPSSARVHALDGGLNNQVYRIQSVDNDLVLRLGHKPPRLPSTNIEMAILEKASSANLGPEVVFADTERGILLTKFLPGETWQREDLLVGANLEALARLLRALHTLPRCGAELDISGIAETHFRKLHCRDDLRAFGKTCLDIVSRRDPAESISCCHNDVVAENVIAGDALRLIDWEWAADNEPLFDLASVIAYHDLEQEQLDLLLDAYSGRTNASIRERLAAQLRLFDALQWLWLAAREIDLPDEGQANRLRTLQSRMTT